MSKCIPRNPSRRYLIMVAVKKSGPMSARQLMESDSNWFDFKSLPAFVKELKEMVDGKTLSLVGDYYILSRHAIAYFAAKDAQEEREKSPPPIVQPHFHNVFTPPMQGYEAYMRSRMRK